MQTIIVANSILVPDLFAKTYNKQAQGQLLTPLSSYLVLQRLKETKMFEDLELDTILKQLKIATS